MVLEKNFNSLLRLSHYQTYFLITTFITLQQQYLPSQLAKIQHRSFRPDPQI